MAINWLKFFFCVNWKWDKLREIFDFLKTYVGWDFNCNKVFVCEYVIMKMRWNWRGKTYIEPLHDFNLIHWKNDVKKVSFYILYFFFIDNVIEIKWKWNCLVSSTLFVNLSLFYYSTIWNIKDQMLNWNRTRYQG